MIAYNNLWLFNNYSRAQADEARDNDCLTPEAYETIYSSSPVGFYTPNIWGRIGIALLTLLAITFTFGFFGLLFRLFDSIAASLLLGGIATYAVLELMIIKNLKHYNSGADNVLMLLSALLITSGVVAGASGHGESHDLLASVCAAFICTFMALRFADTVMSILAVSAWLSLLFFSCSELGGVAMALAPFIIMAAAFGIYMFCIRVATQYRWLLYRQCLQGAAVAALVLLYLAGNYYAVQQASLQLSYTYSNIGKPVPFGWFFWAWTIIVPFAYMALGVRGRNIVLIRTGLLLISVMVLTYRYYYSLLSPDKAMVTGGAILSLTAYAIIRYLHMPKHGFTFAADKHTSERRLLHDALTDQIMNKATDKPQQHNDGW